MQIIQQSSPEKVKTRKQDHIIRFCRERLAHFKAPKAIEFGALPKTATAKIQKFRLREKEWAGYERRVNSGFVRYQVKGIRALLD